MMCISWIILY